MYSTLALTQRRHTMATTTELKSASELYASIDFTTAKITFSKVAVGAHNDTIVDCADVDGTVYHACTGLRLYTNILWFLIAAL